MPVQTYAPVVLSGEGWVNLGPGPLLVQNLSPSYIVNQSVFVRMFYGSAAPEAEEVGFSVLLTTDRPYRANTLLDVWALCTFPAVSVLCLPDTASAAQSGITTLAGSTLAGDFTATGQSNAFTPLAGRGFDVSAWGTFVGSVQLERNIGGQWLPLTVNGQAAYKWTAPFTETVNEPVYGVQYRLNCTAYTSGTINYSFNQ